MAHVPLLSLSRPQQADMTNQSPGYTFSCLRSLPHQGPQGEGEMASMSLTQSFLPQPHTFSR